MSFKLHNAMWPGLVGKGDEEGQEPPISLDRMLQLTADAEVDGRKFDGVDYFLFHPHTDPDASDDQLKEIADSIAAKNLSVGSLVAPVWPGTVGDSAMGNDEQTGKFISAVEKACRIARIFNEHGVRQYGVIRIDSAEFGVEKWGENPGENTGRIAETFKRAAQIAADHGERLAAEGKSAGQACTHGRTCSTCWRLSACQNRSVSRRISLIPTCTCWATMLRNTR